MNIVLYGGSGQVGWELRRSLSVIGNVRTPAAGATSDFRDADGLGRGLEALRPDIVVNAAAYNSVDEAETQPELATQVNARAPGVIAKVAASLGAMLVHYSSDYVFDGAGNMPRDEDADARPLNVYGQTKLEGEQQIQASGCTHLIFRTSWVYSRRRTNFAKAILKLAGERDSLVVADDQIGAPTAADLVADVTAHVVKAVLRDRGLAGTYHLTAAGQTSRFEYARFLLECARRNNLPVRVGEGGLAPVSTVALGGSVRRPLNSRLDTGRLRSRFGLNLPDWQAGVERLVSEVGR